MSFENLDYLAFFAKTRLVGAAQTAKFAAEAPLRGGKVASTKKVLAHYLACVLGLR
jgi:hypothetical protein